MKLNVFDEAWRANRISEYEADPLNPKKAIGYVLATLSNAVEINSRTESDHIFFPDFGMTVTPRIGKLTENEVMLNLSLYAPQWGRELYECSIGLGDTPQRAISVAIESFLFTFLNAVIKMETEGEKAADANIATIFAGKTRNWNVYFSDVAATGDAPEADADIYWERLKKAIIKRLGNQKLCYVKIYAAKLGEKVTVECRVDSVWSEELSLIAAKMVQQWKVDALASHQMFFCIRQDEATVTEYPYSGPEGRARLKEKVKTAVEMFFAADTDEKYERLLSDMEDKLGDKTLAIECFAFLPEICAEHAFRQIKYAETLNISVGEKKEKEYYKTQLADYWPLYQTIFELFSEKAFGDNANEIYKRYVDRSAIRNMVLQLQKKKTPINGNIRMTSLQFHIDEEFSVR